jgi:hypothetical protein
MCVQKTPLAEVFRSSPAMAPEKELDVTELMK